MPLFNNITIIGLGLIGSSIAQGAKKYRATEKVSAFDLNEESIAEALELGIIDEGYKNLEESVKNTDLIIICTPISTYEKIINAISPALDSRTILTDVGSVKESIIDIVTPKIQNPDNFVPAHPIAGSEKSGVLAGNKDLFLNKEFIISPTDKSSNESISKVELFWQSLGSKVENIPAREHDEIYAKSSHIPHLVSFCYAHLIIKHFKMPLSKIIDENGDEFSAFIRLAKSNAKMWTDIFLFNKKPIIKYTEENFCAENHLISDEGDLKNIFFRIDNAKKHRQELGRYGNFKTPIDTKDLIISFLPSFITYKLIEMVESNPRVGGGFLGMTQVILNFNNDNKNLAINNLATCSKLLQELNNEISSLLDLIKNSDTKSIMNYLQNIK